MKYTVLKSVFLNGEVLDEGAVADVADAELAKSLTESGTIAVQGASESPDPLVSDSPVDGATQAPETPEAVTEPTAEPIQPPKEPKQPTEAEIAATLAASETHSDASQDLHIS